MSYYEYLTYEELKESSYRASGRTTRIVDELVQEFLISRLGLKYWYVTITEPGRQMNMPFVNCAKGLRRNTT